MSASAQAILMFTPEWNGMHPGAWRLPDSAHDGATDFEVVRRLVQRAEHAKLHGFFLADPTGFRLELSHPSLARTATAARFEPFTLMAAMAMCTERIGLVMTANTTYEEPYNVARRFASLDRLSGGRAGWNVVTVGTASVAQHFGRRRHMAHDDRYIRAREFLEATIALWDSWEDDAFVRDKAAGIHFDVDKLHVSRYEGAHVVSGGPLNVPRPPQGHPVIAQAGSSPAGRAFAARHAELMFTLQSDLEDARRFAADMRAAAVAEGRAPGDIKILPGLTLVVGRTDEEAHERFAQLDELVDPDVGLELLSAMIDVDLSGLPLDGPLPDVPVTDQRTQTHQTFFVGKARREQLTIRELISFMLRWGATGGSPQTIADRIQEWIEAGAADGFNITFAEMGQSMDLFLDEVVPELQRRGVFQREYRGATLRESLGLRRPANQFAAAREVR